MGPHEDTEARRWTDPVGRASSAVDGPDDAGPTTSASDGRTDTEPAPSQIRIDDRNDWMTARRRERRRERERRWEQLQLVT